MSDRGGASRPGVRPADAVPAPERPAAPPRYPALDAMRGAAAIGVMLYHLGIASRHPQLAPFGFLAVDLFFMMSGFVMTRAYEPRLRQGLSVRAFVGIRVGRIYPMLLAGVLIGACVAMARGEATGVGAAVARSLLLLPDLRADQLFPLNPVLWSLFYELAANLLHALLAPHLTTRRVAVATLVAGAAFAAAIAHYHGAGLGWGAASFVAGFARVGWGYLVGMLLARVHVPISRSSSTVLIVAGLALLAAPAVGFTSARVAVTLFCAFPLALLGAIQAPRARSTWMSSRLGELSYPLYAIHQPLLAGAAAFRLSPGQWGLLAVALVVATAAAGRFVDAPAQARLRRLLTRGARHASRSAPPPSFG